VDITRGIGQSMDQNVQEKAADADDFISRKLSWPALYHSNHWSGVIYNWVQMHVMTIQQDDALLSSANRILQRIDDPVLFTSFCEFMTRFLIKEGKDSIVMALAPAIKASGKLLRNDGILAQFTALQTGDLAPDLIFPPYAGHSSIRQQALSVLPTRGASEKYTLLVFYQSGCGPCEDLLEQLIPQYPELNANGVRVVAMSADRDRLLFENIAAAHPWPDKYCDGLGMEGPNFSRYAVAGTPTLFLLDTEGKILAREASLERVAKLWP
jgi:thiol-disulfide isomerase/thioredoxin